MAWPGWSKSIVPKSLAAVVMAMPSLAGTDDGAGLGAVVGAAVVPGVEDSGASAFLSAAEPPPQAAEHRSAAVRETASVYRRRRTGFGDRGITATASLVVGAGPIVTCPGVLSTDDPRPASGRRR
jgi:hypothetical protein